jgi:hypothetical protein
MDELIYTFSFAVQSYPIDISGEADDTQDSMRVTMVGYSGFERVARQAVADVRRKDYLKRVCESDEEFKYMWRLECKRKQEKIRSMKQGTWKTHLDHVTFADVCNIDSDDKPVSVQKGRFLITIFSNEKKKDQGFLSNKTVQRKGRFWVTKYFVPKVKEAAKKVDIAPKPVVVRKGRFLITTS